jgi:hypothetical protein
MLLLPLILSCLQMFIMVFCESFALNNFILFGVNHFSRLILVFEPPIIPLVRNNIIGSLESFYNNNYIHDTESLKSIKINFWV